MDSSFLNRINKLIDDFTKNVGQRKDKFRAKEVLDQSQAQFIEQVICGCINTDQTESCRHWINYAIRHNTMFPETFLKLDSLIDAKEHILNLLPKNVIILPHVLKRMERLRANQEKRDS